MNIEPADIKQYIFNKLDDSIHSGILLNDFLYNQTKHMNGVIDIPKVHERFNDLAIPVGLVVNSVNDSIHMSGGCPCNDEKQYGGSIIDSTDHDVISDKVFNELLDKVSLKKKHNKSNKINKKPLHKTKKVRWLL